VDAGAEIPATDDEPAAPVADEEPAATNE
jgi:hypothetical protein